MSHLSCPTQQEIKESWKSFIRGQSSQVTVRPEILPSWKRCRAYGVDPFLVKPTRLLDENEIRRRTDASRDLLDVSVPAVLHLYQFLNDARLFVAVSDADGYLLSVYGDTSAIDPTQNILYTAWGEKDIGTNPIGTSIEEDRPLQIFGYEHYCRFPHHFAGAGTPIHAPNGRIIGAISITSTIDEQQPHTLAMIVMTAYAIEQQLRLKESSKSIHLAYQRVSATINTISDGVVILDYSGSISMVNNTFLKQVKCDASDLVGQPLTRFLQNTALEKAVSNFIPFSDRIVNLSINGSVFPCTISLRPMVHEGIREALVLFTELSRACRLASVLHNSQSPSTFDSIVAVTPVFRQIVNEARLYSRNDSTVLLLGESGTGKDVLAQAIHNASSRSSGPFVPVNCGAMQKELVAAELFGYEDGAYTGARRGGAIGKLEYANGGTVFLDEIGEMPLDIQPILLRALESRTITRLGGKTPIPINVRVIAATNRNLYDAVAQGSFRGDLLYRLDVFSLRLPPLRERKSDIPSLIENMLPSMNIKCGKAVSGFTPEAMDLMMRYSWPGNIRELRNYVERCVVLAETDQISADLLPAAVLRGTPAPAVVEPAAPQPSIAPTGIHLSDRRKDELLQQLEQHHWNITRVSQALGVTRATVYRRMARYGIHP